MPDRFEALQDQVETQLRRTSKKVSYETKQYANYRLRELAPRVRRIQRENAYQDYLIDGVQEGVEKYQLYTQYRESDYEAVEPFLADQRTVYDDIREDPVCTCDGKHAHKCPLKRGNLPREVRVADDIDDGIRQFKANHSGRPAILLDRQESWGRFVGDVETELRDLLAVLATDTIPDSADWPPSGDVPDVVQPAD